jgi:two-component system, OmpR family, response regulator VicR
LILLSNKHDGLAIMLIFITQPIDVDMKILIAEDESIMSSLIEHKLKQEGYEVKVTKDGYEALEATNSYSPDLLITDIMMPVTTGLELISLFRAKPGYAHTPILVLSSMDEEAIVLEAFTLGANDFLSKPFVPGELSLRVKKLLKMQKKS